MVFIVRPVHVSGSVAERSKALVLGTSLFGGVGSNPTAASKVLLQITCIIPFWQFWYYSIICTYESCVVTCFVKVVHILVAFCRKYLESLWPV